MKTSNYNLTSEQLVVIKFYEEKYNAVPEINETAKVVIIRFENEKNQPCATMLKGKSAKRSFNYYFSTEDRRETYIAGRVADVMKVINDKAEYKALKKSVLESGAHEFKVGDVLVNSWGYEQTNVDFYQIVKVSKKSVWYKAITAKLHNNEAGYSSMSGTKTPVIDGFKNPEEQPSIARITASVFQPNKNEKPRSTFYAGGYQKWDGKPEYCSWYA